MKEKIFSKDQIVLMLKKGNHNDKQKMVRHVLYALIAGESLLTIAELKRYAEYWYLEIKDLIVEYLRDDIFYEQFKIFISKYTYDTHLINEIAYFLPPYTWRQSEFIEEDKVNLEAIIPKIKELILCCKANIKTKDRGDLFETCVKLITIGDNKSRFLAEDLLRSVKGHESICNWDIYPEKLPVGLVEFVNEIMNSKDVSPYVLISFLCFCGAKQEDNEQVQNYLKQASLNVLHSTDLSCDDALVFLRESPLFEDWDWWLKVVEIVVNAGQVDFVKLLEAWINNNRNSQITKHFDKIFELLKKWDQNNHQSKVKEILLKLIYDQWYHRDFKHRCMVVRYLDYTIGKDYDYDRKLESLRVVIYSKPTEVWIEDKYRILCLEVAKGAFEGVIEKIFERGTVTEKWAKVFIEEALKVKSLKKALFPYVREYDIDESLLDVSTRTKKRKMDNQDKALAEISAILN